MNATNDLLARLAALPLDDRIKLQKALEQSIYHDSFAELKSPISLQTLEVSNLRSCIFMVYMIQALWEELLNLPPFANYTLLDVGPGTGGGRTAGKFAFQQGKSLWSCG